ncbi:hypothetical protein K491DRAFT_711080 [Lophiostoma macrostomum CBS 122681]|uniref:ATP-dependent RNA helicase DHX8 n=1 Tax=Lophiostoma macrostomum CBS 122681 TaxID=1314788 RepID=A0A6A6TQH0_9PLEO|nr:hypothetical protein K491DRAFT_711080 [Lophiostoma macrostomum CBS 122681]
MASDTSAPAPAPTPYRQIRAHYDTHTITVYQAYSAAIAIPAVAQQKLNASPAYSLDRMTWIKPSWAWMLYRSRYSYKDDRQAHILALKLTHEAFESLLRCAVLSDDPGLVGKQRGQRDQQGKRVKDGSGKVRERTASVRVQWDPERSVRLERLGYRSIQIGVPGGSKLDWADGIVEIEDVTERARRLKKVLDEDVDGKLRLEELIETGLVPVEKEYVVDEEMREILGMDVADKK